MNKRPAESMRRLRNLIEAQLNENDGYDQPEGGRVVVGQSPASHMMLTYKFANEAQDCCMIVFNPGVITHEGYFELINAYGAAVRAGAQFMSELKSLVPALVKKSRTRFIKSSIGLDIGVTIKAPAMTPRISVISKASSRMFELDELGACKEFVESLL